MFRKSLLLLGLAWMYLACSPEKSQPKSSLSVIATVDTTKVRIGEKIHFKVSTVGSVGMTIQYPTLELLSDSVQYHDFNYIQNQNGIVGISCEISYWDTGTYWTPAYEIQVLNKDSTYNYSLSADPIQIDVISSIILGGQTTIRPIKGPVPVSGLFPMKLSIMVGLLLFLIGTMIWIWKKRIHISPEVNRKEIIIKDPFEEAISRLNQLEHETNVKLFYVELSYLLRELVERVFYIRTLEMTTLEISENGHLFQLDKSIFKNWVSQLEKADLVKYAKYVPDLDSCGRDRRWASQFIHEIKVLSEI